MRRAAKQWPTSSPDESQKPGASRAVLAIEPLTSFRCPGGAAARSAYVDSKYEPLIRPATCSRSKQICGDGHPCITRHGSHAGRVRQRVLYATWYDGERAAYAGLRLPWCAA